jgi:predicted SprT family Zn-dependent metalloprotease
MLAIYNEGFKDSRANWVVTMHFSHKQPKGEDAIKTLVAHEFAHVLQTDGGYRTYGKMHGREWEKFYNEIMDLIF